MSGDASPWHAVFESSPAAMLLTRPDGRVLAANPAACALFGRTEKDLCRVGRAGVLVADELAEGLLEVRRREGKARGELNLRRADGSIFRAEISSTVFTAPDGEQLTSMWIRDLTEQIRGQRVLEVLAEAGRVLNATLDPRETLQSLASLLVPRSADLCIVDVIEDGEVRRVAVAHRDPSVCEQVRRARPSALREEPLGGLDSVLRTGRAELVSPVPDDFLRAVTTDDAQYTTARALGLNSLVVVPLLARGRTLGAFVLASSKAPGYDEADLRFAQALGERAALALDNTRQHASVLAATRLRDEVLSVVSHDLGNSLNSIRLCAKLLSKRHPDPDIDAIQQAVDHATWLIHDLLLAAKMDLAAVPLDRGREDLSAIFDEVTALHAHTAESKGIQLVARVEGEVPPIELDRHRIVQMLDNLVGNAIKFTAEGRVDVRARIDAGMLVIEVSDTGIGIRPEEIPRVFDRFWQGARAKRAGAGLGLAIARGVAVAHGGDITLRSTLGRGTTFVVTLPLAR